MKIIKLNSFTTFLISMLIIGVLILLPIVLIQALWNQTLGNTYGHLIISFWQALILWLIVLTVLNIAGFFKFEFIVEAKDQDKDTIKTTIEELTNEAKNTSNDLNPKD